MKKILVHENRGGYDYYWKWTREKTAKKWDQECITEKQFKYLLRVGNWRRESEGVYKNF